jgi:hypothetical protein
MAIVVEQEENFLLSWAGRQEDRSPEEKSPMIYMEIQVDTV